MAGEKHSLAMEDRRELRLSGIQDVDSFDEQRIELNSVLGGIDITGENLKIAALDLDVGRVVVSGRIDSIVYGKSREERSMRHKGKHALARLLK